MTATAGRARNPVESGMALMVLAMLWVPFIDALAKLLAETLAPGQISFVRFVVQTVLLAPLMLAVRRRFRLAAPGLQALRGLLVALTSLFFFAALAYMPIADAVAIAFVQPLMLTLISRFFLGEAVGWRRLSAVAVGFAGALLVIRPSFAETGWPALLPVAAALSYSIYLALMRRMMQAGDAVEMQFWAGTAAAIIMGLALVAGHGTGFADSVFEVRWPDQRETLMLLALGAVGTTGQMLVVLAFRRAPAGVLAPFQYLEIISATALGLVLFGDFPDLTTWAGVGLVIGSGLYVYHRERMQARAAA
ncbi:MAG: DMT family transporter [Pseudomonadota bacterium]|nr:DMT family transporter [Pseudomonadota bacterium]